MRISDWAHTVHNRNKITGFVTRINGDEVTLQVTEPKGYGSIKIDKKEIIKSSEAIWLDDIPSLIDLSLAIKDQEWFNKWVSELRKWKRVEEVL
ncbi:hypothetical protein [Halalkalibacterium halodurans]|uniref:hypothetical protein n=1 Tax=Halalkalibacterium halodurans TaxID=86665 RepID=UPI002AAA244E|nr:hypothetical protein [Halalkalibacterium halodurans]MDY7222070.1 hypothetical protein [Halalkalibacterium halodurans]MDY7243911.1 hypothetical protein [Halalkalibacterium halodurans]